MTSKWPAGIERHFWDQLLHPDLINKKQQTLEVLISSWVKIVHGGDGQHCYSRLESTSSLCWDIMENGPEGQKQACVFSNNVPQPQPTHRGPKE